MAVLVTGVGTLIHIYSIGYMAHEARYQRFFFYLNFFILAMLVLVMSNNFLSTFVGWEGVGLASYLLIGFWFEQRDDQYGWYADAGQKGVSGQPDRRCRLSDRHVYHLDQRGLVGLQHGCGRSSQPAAAVAGGHHAAAAVCRQRQERTVPALRLAALTLWRAPRPSRH